MATTTGERCTHDGCKSTDARHVPYRDGSPLTLDDGKVHVYCDKHREAVVKRKGQDAPDDWLTIGEGVGRRTHTASARGGEF